MHSNVPWCVHEQICVFKKSRWHQIYRQRPSSHSALYRPGPPRATQEPGPALPSSQPAGGSTHSALILRHVRFTASDWQSQQLRVPSAGLVGADGSWLRGLPALRTLPRFWRHGGGAEWQQQHAGWAQIQAGGGQHRPPVPRLIKTRWGFTAGGLSDMSVTLWKLLCCQTHSHYSRHVSSSLMKSF